MAGDTGATESTERTRSASRLFDGSRLVSFGRATTEWLTTSVRGAYLYRWLTKEPDPEVIVIDLRETYAVGPFIQLLDWLIPQVQRAWQASALARLVEAGEDRLVEHPIRALSLWALPLLVLGVGLSAVLSGLETFTTVFLSAMLVFALFGTQVTISWREVTETRAFELAVAVLEPPEPPESASGPNETDQRSDDDKD